jgi:hypothetical protein
MLVDSVRLFEDRKVVAVVAVLPNDLAEADSLRVNRQAEHVSDLEARRHGCIITKPCLREKRDSIAPVFRNDA